MTISVDYKQVVADAGIPTTQAAMETAWREEMINQQSAISNDNQYSPFWRLVTALITKPALWILDLISGTILPNAFLLDSSGVFLDLLAYGVNLERKPAVRARGTLVFTRQNTASAITIPAGTIVETAPIDGVIYRMITDTDTAFVGANSTLNVAASAELLGAAYNFAGGYFSLLKTPIAGVIAVANGDNWLSTPGADKESDDLLRARVRNQFNTASSYHTDAVYKSLIGLFPGVDVNAIWFEHDAPRGPGTANAFVLFDFSAPVTQYLEDINAFITDQGNHGHGDDLIVFQMPEQEVSLTIDIWHPANLTAEQIADLQTNTENFIRAAFRENTLYSPTLTYPFTRFSFSKLGKELHEQFALVDSVDFNSDDIVSDLWISVLDSTFEVILHESE